MAGFGLFLLTSAVGRAWCGYTCPQTVWVYLFLVVERVVEGDRHARMKLDAGPWTFERIRKRVVKHAIWIVIGILTGGAWIFYFADAPTLAMQFLIGDAALFAFMWSLKSDRYDMDSSAWRALDDGDDRSSANRCLCVCRKADLRHQNLIVSDWSCLAVFA